MTTHWLSIVIVLASIPRAALAADDADGSAKKMLACATIPHHGERLTCYDRVAAKHPGPDGDTTAVQAEYFGLLVGATLPPPQARGKALESISAKVRSTRRDTLRILFVTLDNGQVWRISSRDPGLRPGDEITIRRSAVGSFTMSVPSRRTVKVRREL